MLSSVEQTILEIDDEVAIQREFGYVLERCPRAAGKACLMDAEWGHPCSRDEHGERTTACMRLGGNGSDA